MARHRQAVTLATLSAAMVLGGSSVASGQQIQGSLQRGVPGRDTPRLMVSVCRSPDKQVAVAATDAIRDRMQRDVNARTLYVNTKNEVNNTLEQSGYPTDEALTTNDALQLARLLRADHFVECTVTPGESGGVNVTSRLILTREARLVQPLGTFQVSNVGDAAQQISREVQNARKQLEAEQRCVNLYRDSSFAEAAAAARRGAAEYPRATISRVCEARAMSQMDAPPDSILRAAQEILEIHPNNYSALALAYEAYKEKGDQTQALSALTSLLAADPSNVALQNQVVAELAQNRQFEIAVPIIDRALVENPVDPQLLSTAFRVYLASENFARAAEVGEQLIPLDTTVTDSAFYIGLASAYAADSQPQKAAEAAARGTMRFPRSATMQTVAAQYYRSAGQLDQASQALSRARALDPNVSGLGLLSAQIYVDRGQIDSAAAALRTVPEGDRETAAQVAYALGLQRVQAGQRDSEAAEPWVEAEQLLELSLTLRPDNDEAKLYRGISAFQVVAKRYPAVAQARNCEQARGLQTYLRTAREFIPAGGRANPELAGTLMQQLGQVEGPVGQLVTASCR